MAEPDHPSQSSKIRVLLVEDNPGDTRLIQDALTGMWDMQFELSCAVRLSDGLERLSKGTFDVILLDLTLPDSTGLDTFESVYSQAPTVPVIVLSGLRNEAIAIKAVQKGAQDYLDKVYVMVDSGFLLRSIRYAIERKRAEGELKRLASFPERNPNAIIEMNPSGEITYLNAAAKAQFPDLSSVGIEHPILRGLDSTVTELSKGAKPLLIREVTLGKRIYEQHLSYVSESQLIRSYVVDITERKQVELLKEEFMATVSHELRTPLSIIREFTEILVDKLAGPLTTDQDDYLKVIQQNANRLARIVNDLLDMSKIEAGHVVLHKSFIDVRLMVDQVTEAMKPLAAGKDQQLTVQMEKGPLGIFADKDKVVQVLINLVNNAIKFTPKSGHVTIKIDELENEIRFRVSDTGIGITPEDVPKLFEKFYQLQQMPDGSGTDGTGLGLAISKRLVELHGGRIWVESRPRLGSTFSFTFPKYFVEEVLRAFLDAGIADAEQKQASFSIGLIAVTDFDELKKRHGQEAVARLLTSIEERVRTAVRKRESDIVVRWQDGEVVVILAKVNKDGCKAMMDRIREMVEQHTYPDLDGQMSRCRFRSSTATYPDEAPNAAEMLHLVEGRLQMIRPAKLRVLTVDDEPKFRRFIKEALEMKGFEVLTAANGPDALELLKTETVDLITLDVMMPVMDGYQVYHLIKENPQTKDIPVLIMTAKGERTDRLLGLVSTSYNYLAKPFQIEQLLAKIEDILPQASR